MLGGLFTAPEHEHGHGDDCEDKHDRLGDLGGPAQQQEVREQDQQRTPEHDRGARVHAVRDLDRHQAQEPTAEQPTQPEKGRGDEQQPDGPGRIGQREPDEDRGQGRDESEPTRQLQDVEQCSPPAVAFVAGVSTTRALATRVTAGARSISCPTAASS